MARIHLDSAPRALQPSEGAWPEGLRDLPDPPASLTIAGTLPELTDAVAIVGTRHADEEALQFAEALAGELARAGRTVISGGAHGIDAAAHAGALAAGGATIAVLAAGFQRAYPAAHAPLFETIARTGALICEMPNEQSPRAWMFLRRNRLIAALAGTVVVVQAPARSGALSTARWARRLGRRLLAVPAPPLDPRGTGCLQLLRSGAEICTSAADVLSLAPFRVPEPRSGRERTSNSSEIGKDHGALSPQAQAVWECLRGRVWHPDQISLALDMPAAEVQEALLTLMLAGLCRQKADGSYATNLTNRRDET
jgi:DNA processing protein